MYRMIPVFGIAIAFFCGAAMGQENAFVVFSRGPRAVIVVAENAKPGETAVALQLRDYIQKTTGIKLLVKRDDDRTVEDYPITTFISVGQTRRVPANLRAKMRIGENLPPGDPLNKSYLVEITTGRIFLLGRNDEMTACAAFDWLSKIGLRWTADGIKFPPAPDGIIGREEHSLKTPDTAFMTQFAGWDDYRRAAAIPLTPLAPPKESNALIAHEGRPAAVIVVSSSAIDKEIYAATELQKYIEQVSGARLAIRRDDEPVTAKDGLVVSVGRTRLVSEAIRKELRIGDHLGDMDSANDGYVVEKTPSVLTLVGHRDEGTVFAVFDFLENLGCRWYFPCEAGTIIPHDATIKVSDQSTYKKPDFAYRRHYSWWGTWLDASDMASEEFWHHANRLDEAAYRGQEGHNFDSLVSPKLFATHPEYFGMVKGKRVKPEGIWQPCLSNPDVIRMAADWADKFLDENPQSDIVTFAPNDGDQYCECPECTKLGGPTYAYLYFCNEVGKLVRVKHPNAIICEWGYSDTSLPPKLKFDGYDNKDDKALGFVWQIYSHTPFRELVNAWSKTTHHLIVAMIWEWNNGGLGTNQRPHYREGVDGLGDLQFYKDHNVIAIETQARGDWANDGLDRYLSAKLTWNIHAGMENLVNDFVHKMFPSAPAEFAAYLDAYQSKGRFETTPEKFLRDGFFLLEQMRGKIHDTEEMKRWQFYALYLHQQVLENDVRVSTDNAQKIAVWKQMVALLKGAQQIRIASSRQLAYLTCVATLPALGDPLPPHKTQEDKLRPDIAPLKITDQQVMTWFEQDRRRYPASVTTVIREPLARAEVGR